MSPRRMLIPGLMAIAVLLAACQGEAPPAAPGGGATEAGATEAGATEAGATEATEAAAELSGSLFAFGFGYKTGDEIAKIRVDRFRKQFPDVKVTFSESGFEAQQFLSALASGEPPDLVNVPRNTIGTFIARGVLEPLDDCIAKEGIDMGAFYESAVAQVTVDGSPYALPEFFNSRIWIMNNPAFKEAGLDPEELDLSDWDAIAAANEKLTKKSGDRLNRIGIDPKLPEFLPLWAWANDSPMISEDGLQSQLEAPGVAEALQFSNGLHEPAGGRTTFLDFRDTWDFFGSKNQFVTDQLAAMPMEQWYLDVLAEASPDVDITVRPFQTRDGEPITWSDGNAWAIPAEARNPEAACAFIRVMTEKDSWLEAAEGKAKQRKKDGAPFIGVYTGNAEADDMIFKEVVDLSKSPELERAVQTVLEVQKHAFALPPSPAAAQFESAWISAVDDVMTGKGDPAEALQGADQKAQDEIEGAAR
ncbi:MAG: extracellular solute-binding protein [Euzebyales bacterium]|nr:extracellular solute-binding protein [Euzebyales bacterium]MBA3621354.1 extracellular solute-binding protein [Euzebyales bacterium]